MTQRRYQKSFSPEEIASVAAFVKSEIGIQEFMDRTLTSNTGSYTMISRCIRKLFKEGKLKIFS